jgi:DNA ligase-1
MGESLIKKAIALATAKDVSHISAEYRKVGDLGLVAMVSEVRSNSLAKRYTDNARSLDVPKNSRASQKTLFKPKALTVNHVFSKLKEIAQTQGAKVCAGSHHRQVVALRDTFRSPKTRKSGPSMVF